MKNQEPVLRRASTTKTKTKITPSSYTYTRSTSTPTSISSQNFSSQLLLKNNSTKPTTTQYYFKLSSLLRSFFNIFTFPTCKWLNIPTRLSLTPSFTRKVICTLYGYRRGHVNFAMQDNPKSDPILLLELATSTAKLMREMSSGLVRIALECEKITSGDNVKLFDEAMWSMYCNGKKCGYAVNKRICSEFDWHVLSTVGSTTSGAGVIPMIEDGRKNGGGELGELMYMRARFERVVGGRDSEAFYMLSPDGNGGPELSIFLLRI